VRSPCGILLALGLFEISAEGVELRLPEPTVALDPLVRGLERGGDEAEVVNAAGLSAGQEPGALEDVEMLRDGRERHSERLGDLGDRGVRSLRDAPEDGAAGRVREGCEGRVERGIAIDRR